MEIVLVNSMAVVVHFCCMCACGRRHGWQILPLVDGPVELVKGRLQGADELLRRDLTVAIPGSLVVCSPQLLRNGAVFSI